MLMNLEINETEGEKRCFKTWGDIPTPCLIIDNHDGEIRLATRHYSENYNSIYTTCLNGVNIGSTVVFDSSDEITISWGMLPDNFEIEISN